MQEDLQLIVDLVMVLAAAAAGGILASLLRQPVLLGYLLAGMIVGPAGLGLIKELVQVETLAQLGVAFLLFALGVEFSLGQLRKVQGISLGGGSLQIVLTIAITTLVSLGVGWVESPTQGIFLGAILSLSSTAVVLKCLTERNETETRHGQVMLGILVVQDVALGLMLAVLPALDQPAEALGWAIASALFKIGLFAAGAIVASIWLIPPFLRLLARTESRELFLLGVVALCLGIALLTEQLGLSIEMGAFVAGLMISLDTNYADQTLSYVEPLRDIFASLFFAAIGMLIDPVFLWQHWEIILGLVALVSLGKLLIVMPLVALFGYSPRIALIAGLGLAQIGEFSFVLASEGQTLGLVSRPVYLLLLGTTAVTLVITPFMLRLAPQLFQWLEAVPCLGQFFNPSEAPLAVAEELPIGQHVVVCGYGRMGRNVVRLLQEHQYPVVVIDQSEAAMQQLREAGIPYIYGNAASRHVLETAGVNRAQGMAIAIADPMATRLCLRRSLELAPELDVVVRAHQDQEIELLYQLGACEVVQPEFEASLELSTHLLLGIGLPLGAVQQEVQQIRNSHYQSFYPEQSERQVRQNLQAITQEMPSHWYTLPSDSLLVNMTLEETDLRRLTGASLLRIQRAKGDILNYPDGQTVLEADDRLLVVANPEEFAAFQDLAEGRAIVPGNDQCCQWVRVMPDSLVVGKTLAELDLRRQLGVMVRAIRREGKFMRQPDGGADLQTHDRLLLCGTRDRLQQAEVWFMPLPLPSLPDLSQLPLLTLKPIIREPQ